jgi:hypothetical protein
MRVALCALDRQPKHALAHGVHAVEHGIHAELLGVDPARLPYVGRNLLGPLDDSPLPRPYGEWLNRDHLFLHRGSGPECYNVRRRRSDDSASCREANAAARREHDLSRMVVADDLQERLRVELAAVVK